jgi:hypothetical protein
MPSLRKAVLVMVLPRRPRPWCPLCYGSEYVRGWERILLEPEAVMAEQTAMAEGVFA